MNGHNLFHIRQIFTALFLDQSAKIGDKYRINFILPYTVDANNMMVRKYISITFHRNDFMRTNNSIRTNIKNLQNKQRYITASNSG
jgi:hypothetical protein